jgi:hypothetical protein
MSRDPFASSNMSLAIPATQSQVPLQKGLVEVGVKGFYLKLSLGGEKQSYLKSVIFFNFWLHKRWSYTPWAHATVATHLLTLLYYLSLLSSIIIACFLFRCCV